MFQFFVFWIIDFDGQIICIVVWLGKEGSILLLIFNGIGVNLELVFFFVQVFDLELEVIVFDVFGVGGFLMFSVFYCFFGLVKLVVWMFDYLDYGQVNVIGVFWGGVLVQQFVYDYLECCKKLIFVVILVGVVMVLGKLKVLMCMVSLWCYIQFFYGVYIVLDIYGGVFCCDFKLVMVYVSKVCLLGKLGYYW